MKKSTNVTVGHLNKQVILRDKLTGELIDYGDAELRTEDRSRNKNFIMIWPAKSRIFELQFFFYLIQTAEKNYILMTDDMLAKKFDTTRQRIGRIKKKLREDKIIKYKPGIIYLNPDIIWRGNAYKREQAQQKYHKFKEEE